MLKPIDFKASVKGPIGLSIIRGSPVRLNKPLETANTEHKGRIAVPALPRYKSTVFKPSSKTPPKPCTSMVLALTFSLTLSLVKASIMRLVSSDFKTLSNLVSPFASADTNKALLDKLLEPGKITLPDTALILLSLSEFFN